MSKYFFWRIYLFEKDPMLDFHTGSRPAGGRLAKTPSKIFSLGPAGLAPMYTIRIPIPIVYALGSERAQRASFAGGDPLFYIPLQHTGIPTSTKNFSKTIGQNFSKTIGQNFSKTIGQNFSKTIGQNFSRPSPEKRIDIQHTGIPTSTKNFSRPSAKTFPRPSAKTFPDHLLKRE
jgi:hypothetical protein